MFGHDSGPAKNYAYGIKAPTANAELVDEQMLLAHRYRNRLCELELARRQKVDDVLQQFKPELLRLREEEQNLVDKLDAIVAQVNLRRSQARSRKKLTKEESAQRKQLRDELRPVRKRIKEIRECLFKPKEILEKAQKAKDGDPIKKRIPELHEAVKQQPQVAALLAKVDEEDIEDRKKARAESGLYWGTYLHVEQSCQPFRKGRPPRFKPWRGDGTLAVQIQNGATLDEIMECDNTKLQIDWVNTETLANGDRGDRRAAARTKIRVRIASTPTKDPVWAEFDLFLHRDLPEGSKVKWAKIIRRRVATQHEWKLVLAVENKAGFPRPGAATGGSVGIDLGWRTVAGKLRVGYYHGSDGLSEELYLEREMVDSWHHVDKKRSERDKDFNDTREVFVEWRKEHKSTEPEWMKEMCQHIHQWKTPRRLATVVLKWRDKRFDGDGWIYNTIEEWRKRDKKAYEHQENRRHKLQRRRTQIYRKWIRDLRARYQDLYIENINWAEMKRKPGIEETEVNKIARYWQNVASVGALASICVEADALKVQATHSTQECQHCGQNDGFDAACELRHTCTLCGCEWDQDQNAAANILKRGLLLTPEERQEQREQKKKKKKKKEEDDDGSDEGKRRAAG
jgi:hypothetical protein